MKDADRNSEPLDTILRRAMREPAGAATPECADAQSLAAYWDKSLASHERERLEAHLADCARCQMQLAAIARAEESAQHETAVSRVPWYRRWQFAIPGLAAVAAVLVFIAIRHPTQESPTNEVVAMAKREAPAANLPKVERAAGESSLKALPAQTSPSNELALNDARRTETNREEARAKGQAGSLKKQSAAPAAASEEAQSAAASAPASAPPPATGGATAFGSRSAAIGGATIARDSVASAPIVMTISPPDRSVTWIVERNGMVERRDARGAMRREQTGVTTDLTAGAAPSASVCWIVGRSGTIIRTTDGGEHWKLIASPIAENLASVSANGANDATIITASGRSFVTTDGGASWRAQ